MENYNKKLFDKFLAGIAAVNVKTHDEYDQFMRMLEKETNLKWGLGEKPTHFPSYYGWMLNEEKTCIRRVVSRDEILFGDISYYESKEYEIIEFSDLMKKENNMKFKVGDKVRVRSWDSMAKEFGVDSGGDIMLSLFHFWKRMKPLCGTVQTIKEVKLRNIDNTCCYRTKETGYSLVDDMLEPVKAETNGEHFRNELRELKGCVVAVVNGKPEKCNCDIRCSKCLFLGACGERFPKWCAEPYEAQEDKPILDDVDREYLSNIVMPRGIYGKVVGVRKLSIDDKYYIHIDMENWREDIDLPTFPIGAHMYEDMKPEVPYTLAQLGIKRKKVK